MNKKRRNISVSLTEKEYELLREIQNETGETYSTIIRNTIRDYNTNKNINRKFEVIIKHIARIPLD